MSRCPEEQGYKSDFLILLLTFLPVLLHLQEGEENPRGKPRYLPPLLARAEDRRRCRQLAVRARSEPKESQRLWYSPHALKFGDGRSHLVKFGIGMAARLTSRNQGSRDGPEGAQDDFSRPATSSRLIWQAILT